MGSARCDAEARGKESYPELPGEALASLVASFSILLASFRDVSDGGWLAGSASGGLGAVG